MKGNVENNTNSDPDSGREVCRKDCSEKNQNGIHAYKWKAECEWRHWGGMEGKESASIHNDGQILAEGSDHIFVRLKCRSTKPCPRPHSKKH